MHPTPIPGALQCRARLVVLDLDMVLRIKYAHDLPIDGNGARNPYTRAKTTGDTLRNAAFSVARVSIQEHAAPGIDRGTESAQHLGRHEQVVKSCLELIFVDPLSGDALSLDGFNIKIQGHRRRTKIGTLLRVMVGFGSPHVCQRVFEVVERRIAFLHQDHVALEAAIQTFHQAEWHAQMLRNLAATE